MRREYCASSRAITATLAYWAPEIPTWFSLNRWSLRQISRPCPQMWGNRLDLLELPHLPRIPRMKNRGNRRRKRRNRYLPNNKGRRGTRHGDLRRLSGSRSLSRPSNPSSLRCWCGSPFIHSISRRLKSSATNWGGSCRIGRTRIRHRNRHQPSLCWGHLRREGGEEMEGGAGVGPPRAGAPARGGAPPPAKFPRTLAGNAVVPAQ